MLRGQAITGIAGSGLLSAPECPVNELVHLQAGDTTVADIGDRVVRQLPGTGWVITFDELRREGAVKVGMLCSEGWWQVEIDLAP